MSTEINTRGAIRSKVLGFPAGNDNECFSKSEILATGKALVNGNYGDNECPAIDDIVRAEIHPLQSEITIKRGTTGIINLSGYLQEITLLLVLGNGVTIEANKVLKVGEDYYIGYAILTFNGNSISFLVASVPVKNSKCTLSIDGKEYIITIIVA